MKKNNLDIITVYYMSIRHKLHFFRNYETDYTCSELKQYELSIHLNVYDLIELIINTIETNSFYSPNIYFTLKRQHYNQKDLFDEISMFQVLYKMRNEKL